MSIIEKLKSVVAPPQNIAGISQEELGMLMATYGPLPRDYHQLVETYGAGSFDDFVWIYVPLCEPSFIALRAQIPQQISVFGERPIDSSLSFWPSEGGALPIGITDNGDLLAWRTRGLPDDWTVIVVDSRGSCYQEFSMNLCGFLLSVLAKDLRTNIFPVDFPSDNPQFQSIGTH